MNKKFPKIKETLYWLRWALIKIKSRDNLYLPRRLSYSIRRYFVDKTFIRVWMNQKNIFISNVSKEPGQLLQYYRQRSHPAFHFGTKEIEQICARIPDEKKQLTIRAATEIVENRFRFRGSDVFVLDPVDWQFNPGGSTGWTWDLNRHFYFTQLGFAYWYTRNELFAEKFFELVYSWIESCSDKLGRLHWDQPFEVAARINAWIWAYFLFLPHPAWQGESHKAFLLALGRLAEYLYQTIEYHSPGNHILLEAKALALCGELFPEFQRSYLWKNKAWRILTRELSSQICSDGVHGERSTMYHRIVTGELLELLMFCIRNDTNKIDLLQSIVLKMAEFWFWITSRNDYVPCFGDAYLNDVYLRFHAPAILTSLKPFPANFDPSDQDFWLLGMENWHGRFSDISLPQSDELAKAFREGGYFISRTGWGEKASGICLGLWPGWDWRPTCTMAIWMPSVFPWS